MQKIKKVLINSVFPFFSGVLFFVSCHYFFSDWLAWTIIGIITFLLIVVMIILKIYLIKIETKLKNFSKV